MTNVPSVGANSMRDPRSALIKSPTKQFITTTTATAAAIAIEQEDSNRIIRLIPASAIKRDSTFSSLATNGRK